MATKKKTRNTKAKPVAKAEVTKSGPSYFSPAGIRTFIHEVQAEFNKVAWPQKKVTAGLTGFVMILVVVISIYLGSVDLLLGKFVSTLLD
ncbi:preprotein translocase subunit SecE [Desulfogranum mediterraneum]|uniref:preprotein translocase subunit SecE n=1 Tax=Desulfogranum mediterraneum TaxID=160661 RepID=UPI0003FB9593|nr:preprotein translocase subunit SecE [Desulfogranum mediterraneum]